MSTQRIPVTAIVLTHDESINMNPCLSAIEDVDDVVIVDSGSTDDTLAEARRIRRDVRVFAHPFKDFGDQRNWAIDNVSPRHPWILFVDADEYCTEAFLGELRAFLGEPGDAVGAYVAGKNYFLGRWLKRCTMHPSYQLRLLKTGSVRFRKEGHGQREVTDGPLVYFKSGWRHHAFSKGLHQWIARHNQYSTDEVDLILRLRREPIHWRALFGGDPIPRRRTLKQLGARAPFRPIVRFLYTYVLRGGFLDGSAGFRYCSLRFAHDIHIMSKLAERRFLAARPSPDTAPKAEPAASGAAAKAQPAPTPTPAAQRDAELVDHLDRRRDSA